LFGHTATRGLFLFLAFTVTLERFSLTLGRFTF